MDKTTKALLISAWSFASTLLLFKYPVAAKPVDPSMENLVGNGILTTEELEVLQSPNPQPMRLTPAQLNPTYPFSPTPESFKQWLKAQGIRVISVSDCSASRTEGSQSKSAEQPLASPTRIYYQCNRVFFDVTDPRGTQRCLGRFVWRNQVRGSGGLMEDTFKNDCRWM